MNREQLINELSDGRTASFTFNKRSGEERTVVGRLGVTRHLKGKGKNYDDAEKGLITVFSFDSGGYRSIPVDRIKQVKAHGKTMKVK